MPCSADCNGLPFSIFSVKINPASVPLENEPHPAGKSSTVSDKHNAISFLSPCLQFSQYSLKFLRQRAGQFHYFPGAGMDEPQSRRVQTLSL